MGWTGLKVVFRDDSDSGHFKIYKGIFNQTERYGIKWDSYPSDPVVIPPRLSKYIDDLIKNESQ